MYENLVHQNVAKNLSSDIKKGIFPGAVLFSGPQSCGKLSAALETARILSCHQPNAGKWTCECYNCRQHKALTFSNLMLLGPRDCALEISAAKKTFLDAVRNKSSFLTAAHYLFVRSIRKLTLRFNGILWQGDKNINKIGNIIEEINEDLEQVDVERPVPPFENLEKICTNLESLCLKLENEFLYDSIPINQIRNLEEWAYKKSEEGKKTIILENSERMSQNVRNALLKILEEPPEDCVFILLTSNRNAIMQTILSRVRTYSFTERTIEQQQDVITRVFHSNTENITINDYLQTFLPVHPDVICQEAKSFYEAICNRKIPDVSQLVQKCGNFSPRIELRLFLSCLAGFQKKMIYSQSGCEVAAKCLKLYVNCWENITLYNQTIPAALEILLKEMSSLNVQNEMIMTKSL